MVAIVTGSGLGLFNSSAATLGKASNTGPGMPGRSGEQTYINTATGNLVVQQKDERVSALGLDLGLIRTYNSQGLLDGDNNDNWRIGFYRRLSNLIGTINPTNGSVSTITKTFGDGTEVVYTYDATQGKYLSNEGDGAHDFLTWNSATLWTWTDGSSRNSETYEVDPTQTGSWRLRFSQDTERDASNNPVNRISYAYNSAGRLTTITDASGQVTTLSYSGNNLSYIQVAQPGNVGQQTLTSYTYNNNRLATVTVDLTPTDTSDARTYVTTYTYVDAASKRIASITQTDGTCVEFAYDASGRILTVTERLAAARGAAALDPLDRQLTFNYFSATETRITDRAGRVTTYFRDAAGRLTGVLGPAINGTRLEARYVYDTTAAGNGNLLSVTEDPTGLNRITTFAYDTSGNLLHSRDPLGNTVSRTYSATNQILSETTYSGRDPDAVGTGALPSGPMTTRFVYDAPVNGVSEEHLRFVVSPEGRVTEHRYNASGTRAMTLRYRGALYTGNGIVTDLEAFANTQKTTLLVQIERVDYTYDFRGQVSTATAWSAITGWTATDGSSGGTTGTSSVTRFTYDQRGQLVSTVEARGEATPADAADYFTSYTYDGLGRVLTTTEWISAIAGTRTSVYQYDDVGNTTTTTLANSLITTSTYNKAGELTSVVSRGSDIVTATTSYAYDANNRLLMTTDANATTVLRTFNLYDEAGRKTGFVDADGSLTEYVYDRASEVIQTIRYANALNSTAMALLVNASGVPLNPLISAAGFRPTTSANDQITRAVYNNAGQLQYTFDAAGAVIETVYNGTGQVTDTVEYATVLTIPRTVVELRPTATLRQMADAANPAVTYIVATHADDRRTRNFYRNDGQLQGTLDAAGFLSEVFYDAAGHVSQTIAYANATPTSNATNPTPRLTGTFAELKPASDNTASYDSAGIPTNDDPEQDAIAYFFYDGQGQKIGTLDTEGYFTETQYDVAGHVLQSLRYDRKLTYTAGSSTFQTLKSAATTAPLPAIRTHSSVYDGLGRVTQETNFEGTITRYQYDIVGNLTSTTRAATTFEMRVTQTRYDSLGRVIRELSGEGSVLLAALPLNAPQTDIDWVWNRHGVKYTYDTAGRRISATTIAFDAALQTDQNIKTLFYYDADNRVRFTVTDLGNGTGEVAENSYNALGQLTYKATYKNRINTAGLNGGLLTATLVTQLTPIADASHGAYVPDAVRDAKVNYTYAVTGQVASVTSAEGANSTYLYNAFGQERSVSEKIDATRTRTTTSLYDSRGFLTTVNADTIGYNVITRQSFDPFGRLRSVTDGRNNTSTFEYDRLGRTIATVDALAGRRVTAYDAFDRVLTARDALNNTTTYAYNDATRNITVTTPELVSVSTVRNRHGETVTVTAAGNTTTYDYGRNGQLTRAYDSVGGTANPLETRTYDTNGRQVLATDARGTVTRFGYDAANRILTRTLDTGGLTLQTSYVFDGQGRVTQVTEPNGRITTTDYDNDGRVTQTAVDPAGLNLRTQYTYDLENRTLTVTEGYQSVAARMKEYRYDSLGRRVSEIDDAGSGRLNLYTTYMYDSVGNVSSKVDARGYNTWYAYDAKNRLTHTINYQGEVSELIYDAEDRVVATRAYATRLDTFMFIIDFAMLVTAAPIAGGWRFDSDTGSSVTLARSSLDTLEQTVFDRDGRARYTIDGIGNVSEVIYDVDANNANGITTRTRSYANRVALATYTTIAQIESALTAAGANDQMSWSVYDLRGRVAFTIDGVGRVAQIQYDGNGNVTTMTAFVNTRATTLPTDLAALNSWLASADPLRQGVVGATIANNPSNQVTRLAYDKADRLCVATDGTGIKTCVLYDALSREVATIDGDGTLTEIVYNSTNQVIKTVRYADALTAATLGTLTDASGNPTAVTLATLKTLVPPLVGRAKDQIARNVYNNAGQLIYTIDALGDTTQSIYDTAGRVTSVVRLFTQRAIPASVGELRLTANANELIDSATSILYPITLNTANDRRTRYFFDGSGLLVATLDSAGYITQNLYDGSGRIVQSIAYANQTNSAYWAAGALYQLIPGDDKETAIDTERDANTYLFYDAQGRAVGSLDAEGYLSETVYNTGGQVTQAIRYDRVLTYSSGITFQALKTAAAGAPTHVYSFQYDGVGRVSQETNFEGTVTSYLYDGSGKVIGATHAFGVAAEARTTQTRFDALGRVIQELSGEGTKALAALVNPLQVDIDRVWDRYGVKYDYDASGRRISTTTVAYDSALNTIQTNKTLFYYDADSRVRFTVELLRNSADVVTEGEVSESHYNALGQLTDTLVYTNRVTGSVAAGLTGGLLTSAIETALTPVADVAHGTFVPDSAHDQKAVYTYALTGQLDSELNGEGTLTSLGYNSFGELTGRLKSVGGRLWAEGFVYDARGLQTRHDIYTTFNSSIAVETREYDAFGQAWRIKDANGNFSKIEYDALGRTTATVDALDGRRTTTYDAFDRVLRTYDALGFYTEYTYDDVGRSVSIRTPENLLLKVAQPTLAPNSKTVHNVHGETLSVTSAGNTLTFEYDKNGQLVKAYDAQGGVANPLELHSYDSSGRELRGTDARGTITKLAYDAVNRVITRTVDPKSITSLNDNPNGLELVTSYVHDGQGHVIRVIEPNGRVTKTDYDRDGRVKSVIVDPKMIVSAGDNPNGLNLTTAYTYDLLLDQALTVTEGAGSANPRTIEYRYDVFKRRTHEILDPGAGRLNLTTEYRYDNNGNLTRKIDARGNSTWFTYDKRNRLIHTINSLGEVRETFYDAEDQAIFTLDYGTRLDVSGFGASADVLSATRTGTWGLTWSFQWGTAPAVTLSPGATGVDLIESTVYDRDGRVRYEVSATGSVTQFAYHANGKVALTRAFANAVGATSYTSIAQLEPVLANAGNDKVTISANDQVRWTAYDLRGQVAFTVDGVGGVVQYRYDNGGNQIETTAFINPRTTTLPMDFGALTSWLNLADPLRSAVPGATIASNPINVVARFTYDKAGRQRITTDGLGVKTFTVVDALGRVIAVVDADGTLTEIVYNAADQVVKTVCYADWLPASVLIPGNVNSLVDASGNPTNVTLATLKGVLATTVGRASDQITRSVYNTTGELIYTIDASGAVTQHFYDTVGRELKTLLYANRVSIAAGTGELTPAAVTIVTDSLHDRRTRFFYDNGSLLLGSLDAAGILTEHAYDKVGKRWQTVTWAVPTAVNLRDTATSIDQLRPASTQVLPANPLWTEDERDLIEGNVRESYLYDSFGRQVGVIDAGKFLTETVYNAANQVTQTIRYANSTENEYVNGLTIAQIRQTGVTQTIRFEYDGIGRLSREIDFGVSPQTEGIVTAHSYDAAGQQTSTIRAFGVASEVRTAHVRYDALGRVSAELSGEGGAALAAGADVTTTWKRYGTTYAYDAAGRKISSTVNVYTPATGNYQTQVTYFYYNEDNRVRYTVDAAGGVTEQVYNALGQLEKTISYVNAISVTGLSGGAINATLTSRITAAASATKDGSTQLTYTTTGALKTSLTAEGASAIYAYNAFGEEERRDELVRTGVTRVTTSTYDVRGSRETVKREKLEGGVLTDLLASEVFVYDAFGRVVASIDARSNPTTFKYDTLGRMVLTVDEIGRRTTTTYDPFDRVLRVLNVLGKTSTDTSYEYDGVARSVKITSGAGVVTTIVSNRHGEKLNVTAAGNTTTYEYNKDGQVTKAYDTFGGAVNPLESFSYDSAGRVVTQKDGKGAVTKFSYDAVNRVLTRTIDPKMIAIAGDNPNGLELTTTFVYDAQGRTLDVTEPSGRLTRTTFDRDGQVTQVAIDPNGSLNLRTTYTYDKEGRALTVTEGAFGHPSTTQFIFDAMGRRIEEIVDPGTSGTLNLRTQYKYDNNGNVTRRIDARGNSTWFTYDAANRQVLEIDALGGVTEKAYDLGDRIISTRRYSTKVVTTGWGDTAPILVLTASPLDRYEQAIYDRDGRARYSIDAMGAVTRRDFDDYGNVIASRTFVGRVLVVPYRRITDLETALQAEPAKNSLTTPAAGDLLSWNAYDLRGQLAFAVDGKGAVVGFQYDFAGNRIGSTAYAVQRTPSLPMDLGAIASWAASAGVANHVDNQTTRCWYDAADRACFALDAEGYLTETRYDDAHSEMRTILYYGPTKPTISAGANLATVVTAAKAVENGVYDQVLFAHNDAAGRIDYAIDARGYRTNYIYDKRGNRIEEQRQLTQIGTIEWAITRSYFDKANRESHFISPEGYLTARVRDPNGNVVREVLYDQRVAIPGIDLLPTPIAGDTGHVTDCTYDGLNRVITEKRRLGSEALNLQSEGIVTQFIYDSLGLLRARSEGIGVNASGVVTSTDERVTSYNYDEAGRLIETTKALGRPEEITTHLDLDTFGNVKARHEAYASADQRTILFEYDRNNRVVKETNALGYATQSGYDSFGNLKTRTMAYGTADQRIETDSYDRRNLLIAATNGAGDVTTYTYDAAGNKKSVTDANAIPLLGASGDSDPYYRNWRKRLGVVYTSGPSVGQGKLAADLTIGDRDLITSRCTVYYSYDRGNLLSGAIDANGTYSSFSYDGAGNKVSATQAVGLGSQQRATVYKYDKDNRLLTVTDPKQYLTTYSYDVLGNQVTVTDANGGLRTNYYDKIGRLEKTIKTLAGAPGGGLQTTNMYDRRGNILSTTQSYVDGSDARTSTYGYDFQDRQTSLTNGEGFNTAIVYDLRGNQKSVTRYLLKSGQPNYSTTVLATTFKYDLENRMTDMIDGLGNTKHYDYDGVNNRTKVTEAYGSTTTTPRTTVYTHDLANRVKTVTTPIGGRTIYTYDRVGNKIGERQLQGGPFFYVVQPSDTSWNLIAQKLYGSTSVVGFLQGIYGVAVPAPGTTLNNLPPVAPGTVALTIATKPYYLVPANPNGGVLNWTNVAIDLYGPSLYAADVGSFLAARYPSPPLAANLKIFNLPQTINIDTTITVELERKDWYYDVPANPNGGARTWANIATELYGDSLPADYLSKRYGATPPARLSDLPPVIGPFTGIDIGDSTPPAGGGVSVSWYDHTLNEDRVVKTAQRPVKVPHDLKKTLRTTDTVNVPQDYGIDLAYGTWMNHTYEYDGNRNLIAEIDPINTRTEHVYDAMGNVIEHRYAVGTPDARSVGMEYDLNNRKIADIDGIGMGLADGIWTGSTATDTPEILNLRKALGYINGTTGAALSASQLSVAQKTALRRTRATLYQYDKLGNRIKATNALGQSAWYYYDADNRLTTLVDYRLTDALAFKHHYITTFKYDSAGNRTEERIWAASYTSIPSDTAAPLPSADSSDRIVLMTYDRANQLIVKLDPDRDAGTTPASTVYLRTEFTYDGAGQKTKELTFATAFQIPPGHLLTWQALANTLYGNNTAAGGAALLTALTVGGISPSLQTDLLLNNLPLSITVASVVYSLKTNAVFGGSRSKQYSYDAGGRLKTFTDVDNTVATYIYDAAHNLKSETAVSPYGPTATRTRRTLYQYDLNNRRTLEILAPIYDESGVIIDVNGVNLYRSTSYDFVGNVLQAKVIDPDIGEGVGPSPTNYSVDRYTYDLNNRRKTETRGEGGVTWNANGSLSAYSNGITTKFIYDLIGNRKSVEDATGNITNYTYDLNNRETLETRPQTEVYIASFHGPFGNGFLASPTTKRVYDAAGNLTQEIEANGAKTTRWYDSAGHVLFELNADNVLCQYFYLATGVMSRKVEYVNRPPSNYYQIPEGSAETWAAVATALYGNADVAGALAAQQGNITLAGGKYLTNLPVTLTGSIVRNLNTYVLTAHNPNVAPAIPSGEMRVTGYASDYAGRVIETQLPGSEITTLTTTSGYTHLVTLASPSTTSIVVQALLNPDEMTQFNTTNNLRLAYRPATAASPAVASRLPYTDVAMGLASGTTFNYGLSGLISGALYDLKIYYTDKNGNEVIIEREFLSAGTASPRVYNGAQPLVETWGVSERATYDTFGNKIESFDRQGNRTLYYYDVKGRKVASVDALGYLKEWDYDGRDNVTAERVYHGPLANPGSLSPVVRPNPPPSANYLTERFYDTAGRLIREAAPSILVFDPLAHNRATLQPVVTSVSPTTTYAYDARGNLLIKTTGYGTAQAMTEYYFYDAANRRIAMIDANRIVTAYNYLGNEVVGKIRYSGSIPSGTDLTRLQWEDISSADRVYRLLVNVSSPTFTTYGLTTGYNYDPTQTQEVTYTYDSHRRLVGETALMEAGTADDRTKAYKYDAVGNRARLQDEDGLVTTADYDAMDRLSRTRNADESITTFKYDTAGNLVSTSIGPENSTSLSINITSLSYEAGGLNVNWNFTGGPRASYVVYDTVSHLTSADYPSANKTPIRMTTSGTTQLPLTPGTYFLRVVTEDSLGNVNWSSEHRVTLPAGLPPVNPVAVTPTVTGSAGSIAGTSPNGYLFEYRYNALKQKIASNDGDGRWREYRLDANGNVVETRLTGVQGGTAISTYTAYDALGHKTAEIDAPIVNPKAATKLSFTVVAGNTLRSIATQYYNNAGLWFVIADANGIARHAASTGNEPLTAGAVYQIPPLQRPIERSTYDALGRRDSKTDALNNRWQYQYNAIGTVTMEIDPTGGITQRFIDVQGRETGTTTPRHGTTEAWTNENRITSSVVVNTLSRKIYDGPGHLVKEIDAEGLETGYGYDNFGRLSTKTDPRGMGALGDSLHVTTVRSSTPSSPTSNMTFEVVFQNALEEGRVRTAGLHLRYRLEGPDGGYTDVVVPRISGMTYSITLALPRGRYAFKLQYTETSGSRVLVNAQIADTTVSSQPYTGKSTRQGDFTTTYIYDRGDRLTRQQQAQGWHLAYDDLPILPENPYRSERVRLGFAANASALGGDGNGNGVNDRIDLIDKYTTFFSYDKRGNRTRSDVGAVSAVPGVKFDGLGRAVESDFYYGTYTYTGSDAYGNPTNPQLAYLPGSRKFYDTYGNLYLETSIGEEYQTYLGAGAGPAPNFEPVFPVVPTQILLPGQKRSRYEAFGRLSEQTDEDGNIVRFQYDNYGRLIREYDPLIAAGASGKDIERDYDSAGRLIAIRDFATRVTTTYTYDLLGRRLREKITTQADAHNAANKHNRDISYTYDAIGRMRRWADASSIMHANINYDRDGNRTQVVTDAPYIDYAWFSQVNHQYQYDRAGRVTRYAELNPAGVAQTVRYFGYDAANNRTHDSTQTYSPESGTYITSTYDYAVDANSRTYNMAFSIVGGSAPTQNTREAWQYDNRGNTTRNDGYNGATVQSYTIYDYTTDGTRPDVPLLRTVTSKSPGQVLRVTNYTYSAAKHIVKTNVVQGSSTVSYDHLYYRDGREKKIYNVVAQNGGLVGLGLESIINYNANEQRSNINRRRGTGMLRDETEDYVYDNEGHVLYRWRDDGIVNTNPLVYDTREYHYANGNPVGEWSGTTQQISTPSGPRDVPKGYQLDSGAYNPIQFPGKGGAAGAYIVRDGDTLQSIANAAYGDASLWYIIADANGLRVDAKLPAGLALNIPSNIQNASITDSTHRVYNEGDIHGSSLPNIQAPQPKAVDKCVAITAIILVVIIAVVVSIVTFGTASGVSAAAAAGISNAILATAVSTTAVAAVGAGFAFVGAMFSQLILTASGLQQNFSIEDVGESTLGGAISGAVAGFGAAAELPALAGKLGDAGAAVFQISGGILGAGGEIIRQEVSYGKVNNYTGIVAASLNGWGQAANGTAKTTAEAYFASKTASAAADAEKAATAAYYVANAARTVSTVSGYVTPWIGLAESYLRYGQLKPMDWTNAIGGTLSHAYNTLSGVGAQSPIEERIAASAGGFAMSMLAASIGGVGDGRTIAQVRNGAGPTSRGEAWQNYVAENVGQEVGRFISDMEFKSSTPGAEATQSRGTGAIQIPDAPKTNLSLPQIGDSGFDPLYGTPVDAYGNPVAPLPAEDLGLTLGSVYGFNAAPLDSVFRSTYRDLSCLRELTRPRPQSSDRRSMIWRKISCYSRKSGS